MKTFTLRISKEKLNKLYYIADYETRSANGQLLSLIKKSITEFEKEHGEIKVED